jgi:hypothetical protein
MKQFKDMIARKRPRFGAPAGATADDRPPTDFRAIAAQRARMSHTGPDEAGAEAGAPEADAPMTEASRGASAEASHDDKPDASPAASPDAEPPVQTKVNAMPANKIWEIEANDDAGDDIDHDALGTRHRARRAEMAAEALRQIEAQNRGATASPASRQDTNEAPATSTRAKTRILGFQTAEFEPDVFSAPVATSSAAGQFPAGWIVVVDGPGRGASFTLGVGVSTIGRDSGQSICLDFGDASVSRQNHASIAYDDEQNRFFIGHGGKSNIVRKNGAPVLSTEELINGDLVRIGKTTLRFVALCGPDFTWGTDTEEPHGDAYGD